MTGPVMLIVIGVLFLLNNLFPGEFSFGRMWPVILIVIGLVKVLEYFRGPVSGPAAPNKPTYQPTPPPAGAEGTPFNTKSDVPQRKEGM